MCAIAQKRNHPLGFASIPVDMSEHVVPDNRGIIDGRASQRTFRPGSAFTVAAGSTERRSLPNNGPAMAQATLKNQQTIIANERVIVANQRTIIHNQAKLTLAIANQAKIMRNQDAIVRNQQKIMANQRRILRNTAR